MNENELQLQKEMMAIAYKEKQLAANVEIGKLQIGLQSEIEKRRHGESRKFLSLMFGGILIFLGISLGFFGWCLSMNKEQFIIELLRYAFYPLSAGGGFWLGRKSIRSSNDLPREENLIRDADIIRSA